MFQLSPARAGARLRVRALPIRALAVRALATGLLSAVALGASGQAQADPATAFTAPAPSAISDGALRAAVARIDFSPMGLLNRSTPTYVQAAPLRSLAATPVAAPAQVNSRELDCMAQAVYFEARGEPALGQAAVAQVVLNRVRHPAFPKSVCGVVFQRAGHSCQFSWACRRPSGPGDTGQWAQARAVAARVMAGEVVASIGLATHFNGARAGGFGGGLQQVARIGAHAFYKFNGAKGAPSMFASPVRMAQAQALAAPRVAYASLLPLPSKAETGKLLASASAAVHQVANVAQNAALAAAQTLAGQGAASAQATRAPLDMPSTAAAPSAFEHITAQVEQPQLVAG